MSLSPFEILAGRLSSTVTFSASAASSAKSRTGFVITTATGMAFTLFRGEPPSAMGDFHIGVALPDASAVRGARGRFRSLQLIEHEWCDEDGYVSVKILDPDGYIVEVSWDDTDHTS